MTARKSRLHRPRLSRAEAFGVAQGDGCNRLQLTADRRGCYCEIRLPLISER